MHCQHSLIDKYYVIIWGRCDFAHLPHILALVYLQPGLTPMV